MIMNLFQWLDVLALAFVFGGIALILWSKNRSKKHPYAGYRQEVSWIDVVAAKKGFELAKEI